MLCCSFKGIEIKWEYKYIFSYVVVKGWNEVIVVLVYGLMLFFVVNFSKYYIKFVVRVDLC